MFIVIYTKHPIENMFLSIITVIPNCFFYWLWGNFTDRYSFRRV